jgi:hypothetical protein
MAALTKGSAAIGGGRCRGLVAQRKRQAPKSGLLAEIDANPFPCYTGFFALVCSRLAVGPVLDVRP